MVPDPNETDGPPSAESGGDVDDANDAGTARRISRRTLLGGAGVVGAGLVGAAALFGDDALRDVRGDSGGGATDRQATPVPESEARQLAEEFAPTLYFGKREKWFPTDPRPYTTERDGETVVDGFDALDGYTKNVAESGNIAPDPTVFYQVLRYTDRLSVVQYWFYSAFDQFSVNFHWHDWELLQAFVDTASGEPVLYVASAHARKVPNNEFLDPDTTPAIITEVGSHSSALGMNESRDTFQRISIDGLPPDVTNGVLSILSGDEAVPLAYGLPRDEGFRLPYVAPELDGASLVDHPDLPNVSASDLMPADITVGSFVDLATPPADLPEREPGPVFEPESRASGEADEQYALVPTSAVEDIAAFVGPQLSFEFYVPAALEDAVSSHLTTTSAPWTQPRYRDPLADVTDEAHRQAIAERFDVDVAETGATVVGQVSELQPLDDGTAGVTLAAPPVEAVARLASDPVAVPTFGGVAAFVDVEPGEHTLTVNGPGYAPYAQRVTVGDSTGTETETTDTTTATDSPTATGTPAATPTETETETATEGTGGGSQTTDGPVRVGADGRVGIVPNEDAVKLNIDASDRGGPRRVRVEDDAAGRLFDAPPVASEGTAGLYVHRAGGYTVEVTDERGETSVERVNPGPNQNAADVAKARTGVSGITRFLVDFLTETREAALRQLQKREEETERRSTATPEPADAEATVTPDAADSDNTATPTPTPSEEDSGSVEDRSTTTPTATPTPTPTTTPTPTETTTTASTVDRFRSLLDDAVTAAERANEAALSGDDGATAEALSDLQSVLDEISALAEDASIPRSARRVISQRVETATRRIERARSQLES